MDVDHRTAAQALVRLATETDLELFARERGGKDSPLMQVLMAFRNDAIEALKKLVEVDPANPEMVRKLQNEVVRFVELVDHVRGIRQAGDIAERELTEEDRAAVFEAVVDGETQGDR